MKMNRLIAALMVAFSLCVVSTKGSIGDGPPNKLPMLGSVGAYRGWIVTNQILSVSTSVRYTNGSGLLVGPGNLKGIKFASEASYQSYIRSNGFRIFSENVNLFDPAKPLFFVVDIGYGLPELDQSGVVLVTRVRKAIGLPSTVTSNSFAESVPFDEHAYVSVPGLQAFRVEVRGLYTNSWPATSGKSSNSGDANVISLFPPELTTNNFVVLNPWYSMATNGTEVRIAIMVNGKTTWYSQFGEVLNNVPTIRLIGNSLNCTFAKGARVAVETSTNMVQWSSFTNFSDLGGVGSISVPMTNDRPRQFFRVGIQ